MEGREVFFFLQRTEKEKGESVVHWDHARKSLPLKVAGEKER